jgi:hypothetical protein
VGPRPGLDNLEKRKFLILPGLELRHFGRPASRQSLYRLKFMLNYRPEVSLNPEGLATREFDQSFLWFSSVALLLTPALLLMVTSQISS